ncbi:transposase [Lederbergia wuyishanensis]|uniref:ABC-type multidrug transport system permease subunit n=1 Tax=Lederbergia wuyishanensis TaxID=1347903 RepID=A0ABU0D6B5_9BACI|nr:transposase [Lederbergia wuyishanensis]MCJ8008680.1 transposase [Lederbergia wuyishanensis]MDQ0343901.1 ABC-type multidrug transport system permease subunit [Lederbergia wuyishanensis]
MKILLVLTSIILPIIMYFLHRSQERFRFIFNLGAIVSAIIFGDIASLSIFEIIKDNTVFMTNIHSIFLNPLFLLSGGYLGIYIMYRLIIITIDERKP